MGRSLTRPCAALLAAVAVAVALPVAATARPALPGLTFTRFGAGHAPESVWVADADGSHARRVTADGFNSALSASGRWLTFEREEAGEQRELVSLFLVDLARGTTRRLGESAGNERWAPSGDRLAVSRPRGLFLIDASTLRETRLLPGPVSSFDFTPDGGSLVIARGRGGGIEGRSTVDASDLFLLRLSGHALVRLTRDRHSRSPLASPRGIVYVRFQNRYAAPEIWRMSGRGSGARLVARCCETQWYATHAGAARGLETVALSASGAHLLACQVYEGGCYPVGIDLPSGRRYTFPQTSKLETRQESASAVDLTHDGRAILVIVHPWDDEPGPRLLYAIPFGGGKPKLLARDVAFAGWRR